MNYTNISNRLRLRGDARPAGEADSDATVLSLENGRHGLCLRVRKTTTAARRKLAACKLALAAVAASACTLAHDAAAQTYFIQPTTEAASKDAKIYINTPTMNFQSNLDVYSTATTTDFSSLVQFSLSAVPAAPAITNATLTLYCRNLGTSSGTAAPGTVSIRPVTSAWSETAADAAVAGAGPLATYNNVLGANPTITLGNVVASRIVNGAGFITFDITSLAQQWQAGTLANNGVYLFTPTAGADIGFDDVDTATVAGSSPSLTITVPEPSTTAAMAFGGVALLLAAGSRLRLRGVTAS